MFFFLSCCFTTFCFLFGLHIHHKTRRHKVALLCNFKGELWSEPLPSFYGIILMNLRKKSLVQSLVVLWSVLTKLWSYKVLNSTWVTSYPRMYKTSQLWFSLHILHSFMVALSIFYELIKLRSFEWLNCFST